LEDALPFQRVSSSNRTSFVLLLESDLPHQYDFRVELWRDSAGCIDWYTVINTHLVPSV